METFTPLFRSLSDRHSKKVNSPTLSIHYIAKVCLITLLVLSSVNVNAIVNYYLKNGADASLLASWTLNADETGSNPTNFRTHGVFLNVESGESGFVSNNWTIGATSIDAESNRVNLIVNGTLTIRDGVTLTLKNETTGRGTINVNDGGKLILESTAKIIDESDFTAINNAFYVNLNATFVTANVNGLDASVIPSSTFLREFKTIANYEFNGTNQTTTGLPATVANLTFSNSGTKTLTGDVSVTGTLTVKDAASLDIVPGQLVTAGTLLNSTGSPYGINLLANTSGVIGSLAYTTGTAQASVQFHSKAFKGSDYKYQFFGIPFTTMNPTGNLDGSWIFKYNEADTTMWEPITNNVAMFPVQGYAITQNDATTYQLTGTLYHDPITSYVLTYTAANLETVTNDYKRGENIIANPYTAAIPISSITFTNMEASVAFFNTGSYDDWSTNNPTTYNGLAGQYLNIPQNHAGTNVDGIDLPANIPSLQGFLVKANPSNPLPVRSLEKSKTDLPVGQSTITIPVPATKNTEALRVKSEQVEKVITAIEINGERFGDKVWLFTEAGCTKNFDNGFDGRKIKGDILTPQFYAQELDGNYQVNSVDDINNTLLGFVPGIDTEYTMKFTHYNTATTYPNGIYLVDLHKNVTVNITESGSTYSFSTVVSNANSQKAASATTESARFKILTSPNGTTGLATNFEGTLKVFSSDRNIIIDNKGSLQGELKLYDAAGRILYTKSFSSGINTMNLDLPKGLYIIHANNQKDTVKSSFIIK